MSVARRKNIKNDGDRMVRFPSKAIHLPATQVHDSAVIVVSIIPSNTACYPDTDFRRVADIRAGADGVRDSLDGFIGIDFYRSKVLVR